MISKLSSNGESNQAGISPSKYAGLLVFTILAVLLTSAGLTAWNRLLIKQANSQKLSGMISTIEQSLVNDIKAGKLNNNAAALLQLENSPNILAISIFDATGKFLGGQRAKHTEFPAVTFLPEKIQHSLQGEPMPLDSFSQFWRYVNNPGEIIAPYDLAGFRQIFSQSETDDRVEIYSPLITNQQMAGVLYIAAKTQATPDLLTGFLSSFVPGLLMALAFIYLSHRLTKKHFCSEIDKLTFNLKQACAEKKPITSDSGHGFPALLTLFNQLLENINDKERLLNFQPQVLNPQSNDNTAKIEELTRQNEQLKTTLNKAQAVRQEAETANRLKSDFLAAMSHEIRMPMNAVLGIADTLWQDNLNEQQRYLLQIMQQSSALLLNLLNDMTDFSKMESGELALTNQEFHCPKLIHENFLLLEQEAKAKGLKYTLEIAADFPYLLIGDSSRLSQILINLLSNAIKFTALGEVRLSVSAQKTKLKTMRLHCEVTDTGIGIGADQLDALFDAFSHEESAMTRIFPGSGIGLTITKQLVQLMHGKIGVHSQPGIGSTFWFWIDFDISKTQTKTPKPQNNYRFNAKLLVAEDYPANQLVVQRFLEDLGCRVEMVNNGFEAVKSVKKQKYDLVFMDCQMPFMDGYRAAQEIRRFELTDGSIARIPIIALTAHALTEDEIKCKEAGMDEWVTKPFTRHDLSKILLKWLPKELIVDDQPVLKTDARTLAKASSVLDETHAINMKFFTRQFKLDNIDDVAFINSLTSAFRENAARTLSSLQHCIDNADAEGIRKQAHGLKSISVNVGSGKLTELCTTMEQAGKLQELTHVQELLDSMKQEYLRVLSELNSLCTKV